MAQQVINIGASEGDGTGDKARIFTDKINDNFDELYKQGSPSTVLTSNTYSLVGDNSTDNNTVIETWITAAAAIIAGGGSCKMVLTPGIYRTTGRHVFPGAADVEFENALLRASGSSDTAPTMQHGSAAGLTSGTLTGIYIDSVVSHSFVNLNCVALRLVNKFHANHQVVRVSDHYVGVQFAGEDGGVASVYNTLVWNGAYNCIVGLEFVNRGTATFCSEHTIIGGDIENGNSSYGSHYGMVIRNDYDTGGADQSGNNWYNPCFQTGSTTGVSWTSGGTRVADRRYYTPSIGGEWLCKTGGASGSTEPSIIPTAVELSSITITSGSAVVTMASTAALSAGMHVKGTNPTDAFPINTYITSVDNATTLTLSKTASRSSTTYKGVFTPTTTDGAAVLVYLGPFRRSCVWLRNAGIGNGIHDARWEASVGEAIISSGVHLWPPSATSGLGNFKMTIRDISNNTAVARSYHPVWAATTAYVAGDMVRPTVSNGTYWDCITAGTSGGTEPSSPSTNVGTTITDGSVTWIVRLYQQTGLVGEYTNSNAGGGNTKWRITCGYASEPAPATAVIDNLNLRAIGSASGWLVKGFSKTAQTGLTPVSNFAAADLALMRDGLLIVQNNILYGTYLNTSKTKAFTLRCLYGAHTGGRAWVACYDANLVLLPITSNQNAYHRRFQGDFGFNSGSSLPVAQTDGAGSLSCFAVNDEVKYVFIGHKKSNNHVLNGFSVTEMPQSLTPGSVQFVNFKGNANGPRMSLGTPTSGYFMAVGEYIVNASRTDGGAVKGWTVKTAGILAPAWVTSTAYLKGQLVTDGTNIYAANGTFTSGTTPSGTAANFLDSTASSITSGDVATWDYLGLIAVLTPDEDTDALYTAGNTGTTPAPNCANGLTQVWTMNNNITVGAPTNAPQIGSVLTLVFVQDATGTRTIAWNATYRNAPAWSAGTNAQKASAVFQYNGTGWQFVGGSSAFA